jgi:hypothetical protein
MNNDEKEPLGHFAPAALFLRGEKADTVVALEQHVVSRMPLGDSQRAAEDRGAAEMLTRRRR